MAPAQTTRQAAEREVRAALELMPQLVWTTTADGYHDYYNERWYVYTGMPRPGDADAHAEGWNWKTYLHPDDYERTLAVWSNCLATGEPYEIEYRFRERATGDYRWFLGRALPLRDADGGIVRWFGTCTDIDEQRRAAAALVLQQNELAASEIRFRLVQDAAPTGFGIQRPVRARDGSGRVVDFTMTYVNAAGARMFGQSADESVGRSLRELFPGIEKAGLLDAYAAVLESGVPLQREVRYQAPDGTVLGVAVTVVRVGAGDDAEIAVSFADISERQRAESERARLLGELTIERERLRSVILDMPAPLALHSGPEHRFALINDAYRALIGGRDVTGMSPQEAFPDLAGTGIHEQFVRVAATGEPWVSTETHIAFDRAGVEPSEGWFDVRLQPVHDASGDVIGILNFSLEVTVQVRARLEVERLLASAEAARAEAEAANRAKSEFLAVMSHELRTPLNAIGGYTELIQIGVHGPVTEAQLFALERVQRSQRHLLGLINGVLNYAKIDAGHVHYAIAEVPLDEVLATCEALVAPQVRTKRLTFVNAGCKPTLRVRADGEKLQQVVLNLLSNAVKFTEPGGRVELGCGAVDGMIAVWVTDSGIGIAPSELGRVFEPFVQVDARLTRTQEGTGLGLAISRDLARGMGGELVVESSLGSGSRFTLTLPRA